jgi:hypothetical protein
MLKKRQKSIDDELKSSTLTALVRDCMREMGRFTVGGLEAELVRRHGLVPSGFKRRIVNVVGDFSRRRIIRPVEPARLHGGRGRSGGTWEYVGLCKKRRKIDIIWHLIRSGRRVTFSELVKLSGASPSTVREYMRSLVCGGYVRRVKMGHYILIMDTGPDAPENTEKTEKNCI